MEKNIRIAVVDDHGLYRNGLIQLITSLDEKNEVIFQASNGQDFFDQLLPDSLPDLAIVDIDMPIMNGFETAEKIQKEFPQINTLIVTMSDDEQSLIKMLRFGVKGFLSKDVEPEELNLAITRTSSGRYHDNEGFTGKLIQALQNDEIKENMGIEFNEREMAFLELCCSELTYKEIAEEMYLSPKTIDGYRSTLFDRVKVKTRIGLVIYALKNGLVLI